ncbi:MAG: 23S rRNA (uracil(1939)-C(5))-methyltransferase RlmD [Clostridiales bacterium]|nr:23S rRNA (uracil(1939)-C(5))-methyltransferase RlmD [Clostridiales bacterium]
MLKKNDEIELVIDGYTAEGSGVGHFDGMAVFVANSAVGDRLKVHIIKAKKTYAIGKITEIISPSPDRIETDCPYFNSCGGCAFRHISYQAELNAKKDRVEQAFSRLARIDIKAESVCGGETERYRNKAQFPVGFDGDVKIGFFAPRSHRIVDCPDCLLQPEDFSEIVNVFREWIKDNGISLYDEETHKGVLRHIYLRKATATGEIMACAVINADCLPAVSDLAERLKKNESIKTFVLNINKEKTNVILGDKCVNVFGDGYITDILCKNRIRISPLSFYQVNKNQAQKLYEKALEYAAVNGDETVLDLYCGAGTIGLSMAKKVKRVIGVEIIPEAVEDAKINAAINDIDNADFFCSDASEAAQMLKEKGIKPDCIILDPPRKGCDNSLIKAVSEMNPERIVYVSCDPATLARDCAVFKEYGYNTDRLSVFDLFPRTVHVESVVLLRRE